MAQSLGGTVLGLKQAWIHLEALKEGYKYAREYPNLPNVPHFTGEVNGVFERA